MPEKFLAKGLEGVDTVGNREPGRPPVLGYPLLDSVGLLRVPGHHGNDAGYHVMGVVNQLLLVDVGFESVAAFSDLPGVENVDENLA